MKKTRVLIISHTSIVTSYQDRIKELSKISELEIALAVPNKYQENLMQIKLVKKTDKNYKIYPLFPFTWFVKNKTLINVTHFYPELWKVMLEFKPDIIDIIEEPYSFITTYTILLKTLLCPNSKICFFSAQNIIKKFPFIFDIFEKYVFRSADLAFPVSNEVLDVLKSKGYKRKAVVLPLGINRTRYFQDNELKKNKDLLLKGNPNIKDTFVVGFMGRLVEEKGIYDLLKALLLIKDINWSCCIIGRGPERDNIVNFCSENNITDRMILTECSFEQVPQYLNCIDLMVMPSKTVPHWKEQFGRVVIESWSCGVPVIGSDSGEISEVIGNDEYIFEDGNIEQLASLVKKIYSSKELYCKMLKQGQERLNKYFTWKKIAKKTYNAYKNIV